MQKSPVKDCMGVCPLRVQVDKASSEFFNIQ